MEWSVSIPLLNIGGKISTNSVKTEMSWKERADQLGIFLLDSLTDSEYIILFDEFYEHYQEIMPATQESFPLLRGLIRAIHYIRSTFYNFPRLRLFIFLRDDIYDVINDPDKNKWSDHLVDLVWSRAELRKLVDYRVQVASGGDPGADIGTAIKNSSRKSLITNRYDGLFEFMLDLTHQRPRDIIKLLQITAEDAAENGESRISSDTLARSELKYSSYLRQELVDEIHTVFPPLDKFINLFYGERTLPSRHIELCIVENGLDKERGLEPQAILQLLYYYNVIGVAGSQSTHFRFMDRSIRLNTPCRLMLHPGLRRRLRVM